MKLLRGFSELRCNDLFGKTPKRSRSVSEFVKAHRKGHSREDLKLEDFKIQHDYAIGFAARG